MNWLINAAERVGGHAEGRPKIPAGTPLDQAYAMVARAYGITEATLAASVATLFRLQPAALDVAEPRAIKLVPEKLARRHRVLPQRETHDEIVVATSDPTDHDAERALEFIACRRVVMQVAEPRALAEAIEASYAPGRVIEALLQSMNTDTPVARASDVSAAPVERLVQLIIDAAVAARATAVRVEPGRHQGRVRFRVDGAMRPFMRMPPGALARVVSHVKALAGLDVAERLRPQHGSARIEVASGATDLRVSTFPARDMECVEIRLGDSEPAHALDRAPVGDANSGDESSARQRILLVHADAGARTVVAALLASSGYCVEIADDGAAAVDRLVCDADFALVALDLDMPGMCGAEVLRRMRAEPGTAGLPVLVLTGDAGGDAETSLMNDGADDYVRTALDPARFVARVRAVLRRAAA